MKLIGKKAMNLVVSHLEPVRHAVHEEAKGVGDAAQAGLDAERSSTKWHKIHGPAHLTTIIVRQHEVDSSVELVAPNAVAIEFGHAPSGVFAGTKTKSPEGLYILHKAAGFGLE